MPLTRNARNISPARFQDCAGLSLIRRESQTRFYDRCISPTCLYSFGGRHELILISIHCFMEFYCLLRYLTNYMAIFVKSMNSTRAYWCWKNYKLFRVFWIWNAEKFVVLEDCMLVTIFVFKLVKEEGTFTIFIFNYCYVWVWTLLIILGYDVYVFTTVFDDRFWKKPYKVL